MSQSCLIVGAGHAGGRAAEALRKHGFEGDITLIGEEPTYPFERPPLSKQFLKEPDESKLPMIRPQPWYAENKIATVLGRRATILDSGAREIELDDGTRHGFDHLLLTVGGAVRKLNVPGKNLGGIHYIRGLSDSQALHADLKNAKRVVVVGGGFIGLEAAAIARELGAEVTVLEASPQLMGRAVLPVIANVVEQRFTAQGVGIELNAAVSEFSGDAGKVNEVHVGDRVFPCDVAIVGIGIVPETAFAESGGVTVNNGIVVDEHCRTNVANVYAAGDVTWHHNPRYGRSMRLESWQNAQNQGIAAARNIAGDAVVYDDVPWFWSDQFDFKIQAAGAPLEDDQVIVREEVDGDILAFSVRDNRVTGLQSLGVLKDMRRARKLLEKDINVDYAALADPDVPVKDLLKG